MEGDPWSLWKKTSRFSPGLLQRKPYWSSIEENLMVFLRRLPVLPQKMASWSPVKEYHLVICGRRPPHLVWQKTPRSSMEEYLQVFYPERTPGLVSREEFLFLYRRRPTDILQKKTSWYYIKEDEGEELLIFNGKVLLVYVQSSIGLLVFYRNMTIS